MGFILLPKYALLQPGSRPTLTPFLLDIDDQGFGDQRKLLPVHLL